VRAKPLRSEASRDSAMIDLLRREFRIEPITLSAGPRGFVAETFVADDHDGRRFFIKWLPTWASAPAMKRGLAVAEPLRALGLATVNEPIATNSGELSTEFQGRALAIFTFIDGERGAVKDQRLGPSSFNYDFGGYVDLLASIHRMTSRLGVDLPIEDFSIPWAGHFERVFARALEEPFVSQARADLRRLLRRRLDQINVDWLELKSMSEACRRQRWSPVLTHGDLLGDNLIIGPRGGLHPIDWDDPVMAPPERDTWFFLNDPEARSAFVERYRRTFPGYEIDEPRRRFYLFWRFFQDLSGYLDIILDDPAPDRQAWSFSELQKTCIEWLWPPMRAHR
jgi:spectinomycin phosphotransferase